MILEDLFNYIHLFIAIAHTHMHTPIRIHISLNQLDKKKEIRKKV